MKNIILFGANGIYLDLDFGSGSGSALDFICTKKNSRGWKHTYDYLLDIMKELLPSDWDDEKYNDIYELSKQQLGTHLP
jgi:hypothetical protein